MSCTTFNENARVAIDDLGQPLLAWSIDLCAPVFLTPRNIPDGNGFQEFISVNTARAAPGSLPDSATEPCHHVRSVFATHRESWEAPVFCSMSDQREQLGYARYACRTVTSELPEDLVDIIPIGFCAMVGMVNVPRWTEAQFRSHKRYCRLPV